MAIGQDGTSCFYSVLGVAQSSSAAEIRAAYRNLAMMWHPDKCRGLDRANVDFAKQKFQEIQQAYDVLSDGKKKTLYDLRLYDASDDDVEGLHDFVGELFSKMSEVRTQQQEQNESFQDLQRTFLGMFRADLKMWGLDFSPEKEKVGGTLAQHQQVPARIQRPSSSRLPREPCQRLSMSPGFAGLKRHAEQSEITELLSDSKYLSFQRGSNLDVRFMRGVPRH